MSDSSPGPATDPLGQTSEAPTSPAPLERRSFLGLTAAITGLLSLVVGVPVVAVFLSPWLRRRAGATHWVSTGTPASELEAEPKLVEYRYPYQEGWYTATRTRRVLVLPQQGAFTVFDTECTHLGCMVTWRSEEQQFYCPCHGGIFDPQGRPVSGPVSEPLRQLPARVSADGELQVGES